MTVYAILRNLLRSGIKLPISASALERQARRQLHEARWSQSWRTRGHADGTPARISASASLSKYLGLSSTQSKKLNLFTQAVDALNDEGFKARAWEKLNFSEKQIEKLGAGQNRERF